MRRVGDEGADAGGSGFERYAKTTGRAAVLAEIERVVPWSALCALIEPFYTKPGNGRPPVGFERMLRIYFLQEWFNLAVEDAAACHRAQTWLGRQNTPEDYQAERKLCSRVFRAAGSGHRHEARE